MGSLTNIKTSKDNKWHQVVILDQNNLPGKSLVQVIDFINPFLDCKFVIMDYLSGAIPSELSQMEKKIQDLGEVLRLFDTSYQVEKGDFFLFKEWPLDWKNKEDYPFVIRQSDAAISVLDSHYIYVHIKSDDVLNLIVDNYTVEPPTTDYLENLNFPG